MRVTPTFTCTGGSSGATVGRALGAVGAADAAAAAAGFGGAAGGGPAGGGALQATTYSQLSSRGTAHARHPAARPAPSAPVWRATGCRRGARSQPGGIIIPPR